MKAWNSTLNVTTKPLRSRKRLVGKHKYNAKRIFREDRMWDSTGEWQRYCQLQLLERAGEIQDLECQPVFKLTRAQISYRADFCYIEKDKIIIEDFKGVMTPRFNMICKLWRYYGPTLLRITGRRGKGFIVTKEIMPEIKGANK